MTDIIYDNGLRITRQWFQEVIDDLEFSAAIVNYELKTADYTADLREGTIGIDATSNTVAITIPAAVGNTGKRLIVKAINIDNAATIYETGVGVAYTFTNVNEVAAIMSDGTNWIIINATELLNSHMADSSTHNVTEILGKDEAAVMQNKSTSDTFNIGGSCTIADDLTVNGTTTTINTETLDVEDANITVNKNGNQATADTNDAGLTIEMSDAADVVVGHDSTTQSKMTIDGKEIVTVSDTQILTNKTISNPDQIDAKLDTYANLATYAALGTTTNGQFCFATDTKVMYQIIDNVLSEFGGGEGGVSDPAIYSYMDGSDVDNWTQITGAGDTLIQNTTGALNNTSEFEYTMHTVGDKYRSPTITLSDRNIEAITNELKRISDYNGDTADIEFSVYDVTNSAQITGSVLSVGADYESTARPFNLPSTCLAVAIEFEVITLNAAKVFKFTDVVLKDAEFTQASLSTQETIAYTGYSSITSQKILFLDKITDNSDKLISVDPSGGFTKFIFSAPTPFVASLSVTCGSIGQVARIRWYNSSDVLIKEMVEHTDYVSSMTTNDVASIGDYLIAISDKTPSNTLETNFSVTATAVSENVLVSSEQALEKQVDLTVTDTGLSSHVSKGIYYTTTNGEHRLRFNIIATYSSSVTIGNLAIAGVLFPDDGAGSGQACALANSTGNSGRAYAYNNSNIIRIREETSGAEHSVSGDIRLAEKPDWGETLTGSLVVAVPNSEIQNYDANSTSTGVLSNFGGAANWLAFVSVTQGLYTYDVDTSIFTEFPKMWTSSLNPRETDVTYGTFPRFTVDFESGGTSTATDHTIFARKSGADRKEMGGFIGAFHPKQLAYVNVDAANYTTSVAGSGTYKAINMDHLSGDNIGLSLSADQVTFRDSGTYDLTIPVGSSQGANNVSVMIYNITTAADIEEFVNVVRMSVNEVEVPYNTVFATIKVAAGTTIEIQTKSSGGAGSEYAGRIGVEKREF